LEKEKKEPGRKQMKGERTDDGKNGNNGKKNQRKQKESIQWTRERVSGKLNLRGNMNKAKM
jgi:hypothetical protein